jgi:hypothetical protein
LRFMSWGIALEGRTDPAAILLLFDDRREAEEIAFEVRRRGHPVVVRPCVDGGAARLVPVGTSTSGAAR